MDDWGKYSLLGKTEYIEKNKNKNKKHTLYQPAIGHW